MSDHGDIFEISPFIVNTQLVDIKSIQAIKAYNESNEDIQYIKKKLDMEIKSEYV